MAVPTMTRATWETNPPIVEDMVMVMDGPTDTTDQARWNVGMMHGEWDVMMGPPPRVSFTVYRRQDTTWDVIDQGGNYLVPTDLRLWRRHVEESLVVPIPPGSQGALTFSWGSDAPYQITIQVDGPLIEHTPEMIDTLRDLGFGLVDTRSTQIVMAWGFDDGADPPAPVPDHLVAAIREAHGEDGLATLSLAVVPFDHPSGFAIVVEQRVARPPWVGVDGFEPFLAVRMSRITLVMQLHGFAPHPSTPYNGRKMVYVVDGDNEPQDGQE